MFDLPGDRLLVLEAAADVLRARDRLRDGVLRQTAPARPANAPIAALLAQTHPD